MKEGGAILSRRSNPSILLVTATRIGDAVLSTGLLDHLVQQNPTARFTVAAGPVAAPLFLGLPRLEKLISLPKRSYARHWFDLFRQVAAQRWDAVFDLRGSALAWLLRARTRHIVAKGDPNEHRVVQLGKILGLDPPPSPRLWLRPQDRAAASRLIPGGSPVLAIAPAANWKGKQWPPKRFAELVTRLTKTGGIFEGARVAIFAAPHERDQVQALLSSVQTDRRLDLLEANELLTVAAALERTAFFIGNDSGLMHMAAAVNIPTLGLFGPSRETHYAPWGEKTAVVRTPLSLEELTSAPDYDHRTTGSLMTSLNVDSVEAAVTGLVEKFNLRERVYG